MLKRIYIDNFRCLGNFQVSCDSIKLFLGSNGAGKSSVFHVLQKLQSFICGDTQDISIFQTEDLTSWNKSLQQTFELEIDGHGGTYRYELIIEADALKQHFLVFREDLSFNDKPLLSFHEGEVQLYNDDYSQGPSYPFNWSRSAVASILPRDNNTKLSWFKGRMKRFIIVQINPLSMRSGSEKEETLLTPKAENFVSWYRYISQNQGKTLEITRALQEKLEGFQYFNFKEAGEQYRFLQVFFKEANGGPVDAYKFSQLSDGQRVLIVLYTLLHYTKSEDYTLCIDEPANFLALSEIKPWLNLLYDFCSAQEVQAVLISHHPEYINYLALSSGYWFYRSFHTPARVKPITEDDSGVSISELVARGWIDE